jgi:hypothetical protein
VTSSIYLITPPKTGEKRLPSSERRRLISKVATSYDAIQRFLNDVLDIAIASVDILGFVPVKVSEPDAFARYLNRSFMVTSD